MNGQIRSNQNRKCQFYVVIGKHDRQFTNSKYQQYFTAVPDINLIRKGFDGAFKKKKMDRIPIEEHLIFLIPDADYFNDARELMDKLDRGGKIQIVPPLKKKELKPVIVSKKENEIRQESDLQVKKPIEKEEIVGVQNEQVKVEAVVEEKPKEEVVKEPEKPKYSYNPANNIYHGDFNTNRGEGTTTNSEGDSLDVASYMWGKEDINTKKLVRKSSTPKSAAFIDLPVIVFVLSALLLVGSIVLLFVLK